MSATFLLLLQQAGATAESGADSGTATDAATIAVTLSSSDAGTVTEAAAVSVTFTRADTGAGTDTGVVAETGAGGEAGAGSESGTVVVSFTASDTGTATDAGSVQDVSGATAVSSSDSGTATEGSQVVDLTPPVPAPGGRYEPGGDETSIYPEFRALVDGDSGVGREASIVTRYEPLSVPVRLRPAVSPPERLAAPEARRGAPEQRRSRGSADAGRAVEGWSVLDLTPSLDDEVEFEELLASGALDMLLA